MKNICKEIEILRNEIMAICSGIKTAAMAVGTLDGDNEFSGCDAEILLLELIGRLEDVFVNLEKIQQTEKD